MRALTCLTPLGSQVSDTSSKKAHDLPTRGLVERSRRSLRCQTLRAGVRHFVTEQLRLAYDSDRLEADVVLSANEELAYGLRSIAAPILSRDGDAVAAINLAAHSSMVSIEDLVARLSPTLRGATADISARLGYRP
jgi:DNA-binding IclR family transcriptional regulator